MAGKDVFILPYIYLFFSKVIFYLLVYILVFSSVSNLVSVNDVLAPPPPEDIPCTQGNSSITNRINSDDDGENTDDEKLLTRALINPNHCDALDDIKHDIQTIPRDETDRKSKFEPNLSVVHEKSMEEGISNDSSIASPTLNIDSSIEVALVATKFKAGDEPIKATSQWHRKGTTNTPLPTNDKMPSTANGRSSVAKTIPTILETDEDGRSIRKNSLQSVKSEVFFDAVEALDSVQEDPELKEDISPLNPVVRRKGRDESTSTFASDNNTAMKKKMSNTIF